MDSWADTDSKQIETILGLIVIIAILFLIFVWSPHQLYLAFAYGVMPDKVAIAPYPDDECSFWHVPRGWKDCWHEKLIRTVDGQGRPVAPDSPLVDRVIVTWDPAIEKHNR